MNGSFAEIVEEVKALSVEEKQELHELIEKYLIEERREEIYQTYICSISELQDGKAEFSSDTDKLKALLLND
jgi:hypothetical protein